MQGTPINDNERELLSFFASADADGQMFIVNALCCAVRFGESFFEEIAPYLSCGDANGIKAVVNKLVQA